MGKTNGRPTPWRGFLITVVYVLAAVTVQGLLVAPARAAEGVTVTVAPASLTLQPGDLAHAQIVLANTESTPITVTGVDILTSARVVVEVERSAFPLAVAAGDAARVDVHFAARAGLDDAEAAVVVQYTTQRSGGRAASTTATATITITAGKAASTPELAFVGLPDTLNDGELRHAAVRIVNPAGFAYAHLVLSTLDADDVGVALAGAPSAPFSECPAGTGTAGGGTLLACLMKLEPGETRLLEVEVIAHESVRTGKHHVGVVLTGSRLVEPGGSPLQPVTVVATGDVALTIFGVDALSPFGIGTLFVLPGLVAVLIFLVLARLYPRAAGVPETVQLTDLRMLPFVAVAAAVAYLLVWLIWGHNLTRTAGTADVVILFAIGLGLGIVVWGIVASVWWRLVGRKRFTRGDGCRTVLRRLRAREESLSRPVIRFNGVAYYHLAHSQEGKVLAAPLMTYAHSGQKERKRQALANAVEHDDIGAVLRNSRWPTVRFTWVPADGVKELDAPTASAGTPDRLVKEVEPRDLDDDRVRAAPVGGPRARQESAEPVDVPGVANHDQDTGEIP